MKSNVFDYGYETNKSEALGAYDKNEKTFMQKACIAGKVIAFFIWFAISFAVTWFITGLF